MLLSSSCFLSMCVFKHKKAIRHGVVHVTRTFFNLLSDKKKMLKVEDIKKNKSKKKHSAEQDGTALDEEEKGGRGDEGKNVTAEEEV